METIEINGKQYQLDIEKATERGLLKEKDNKPRSWEEYCNQAEQSICDYDTFSAEDEAKAFIALGKLIQLRDAWWGEWRPNISRDEDKYIICNSENEICTSITWKLNYLLPFPTEEMCNEFLNTFRDLIETAKMFL